MATDLFAFPRVETLAHDFDAEAYLQERPRRDQFVMVEYGHNAWPLAWQQGFDFTSESEDTYKAYVGVEGWIRDPQHQMRDRLQQLKQANQDDQNILFVNHDLGGTVTVEDPDDPSESWYEGPYNAATTLNDSVAHEVVASNVVGDPLSSFNYNHLQGFLKEMNRVCRTDGVGILRECITPENTFLLTDDLLRSTGWHARRMYTPEDPIWDPLESKFNGNPSMPIKKDSYYLFLGKLAAPAEIT